MKRNLKKLLALLLTLVTVVLLVPVGTVTASAESAYAEMMNLVGATVRYTDKKGNTTGVNASGLRFAAVIDKQSDAYKKAVPEGTYASSNETVKFGMWIIPTDLLNANAKIMTTTEGKLDVELKSIYAQDENELHFTVSLLGIPEEDYDRDFTVRLYMKTLKNGKWQYTYSSQSLVRNLVDVANDFYFDNRENEALCTRLDELFLDNAHYQGKNIQSVTFELLADLHYKQGMYISSVADLQTILDRAQAAGADFVMQMGDFSNDWKGSPELTNAYLQNGYQLPVFGIYGNHELESSNSMEYVTPKLTNQTVVWGTSNGQVGDGSIAYYYYDVNGFRIVCTDSNYSYNPTTKKWEHNYTGSYGAPSGNQREHSFGPDQLTWIEEVLTDAANKGMRCIFFSHASVCKSWSPSPDTDTVQAIFAKVNDIQKGTVMMAVNGHLHKNHTTVENGVLYLDMNTVRNGLWRQSSEQHYTNQTFEYVGYDNDGNVVGKQNMRVSMLSQANNTYFFEDAMSATVTITSTGRIIIKGMTTTWLGGVVPENLGSGMEPVVSSGVWRIDLY